MNKKDKIKKVSKKFLDKKLISDNMPMITSIAHKYKHFFPYLDFDDLVSEGIFGLYEANKSYDKRKNVKFSTYARFWVQKYIQKYISESFTMLKVPLNVLKNLKNVMNYISKSDNKKVSLEDIAKKLNFDIDKVKDLLVEQIKTKKSFSLDKYLDDDEQEENFYSIISDNQEQTPDTILQSQENKDYFYNLLSYLTPQEAEVIKLRFGLEGNQPHSLKDIAQKLKISSQRAKELEVKSLMKLKDINKKIDLKNE